MIVDDKSMLMKIVGKLVGAASAFILSNGNLWLTLFGGLLGHWFDRRHNKQRLFVRGKHAKWASVSLMGPSSVRYHPDLIFCYCQALFTILGRLFKLDGRVSEAEIRWVEQLMADMSIGGDTRERCIEFFRLGKDLNYDTAPKLSTLFWQTHPFVQLQHHFVEVLVKAIYTGEQFNRPGWVLVLEIAAKINYPESKLWQLRHKYEDSKAAANAYRAYSGESNTSSSESPKADHQQRANKSRYRGANYQRKASSGRRVPKRQSSQLTQIEALQVLGISSVQWRKYNQVQLKRTYRKLMSQHHPDKLIAAGATDLELEAAKEKTQRIRAAYETLMDGLAEYKN